MTITQLENFGIPTNEWCVLNNTCNQFLFSNENHQYTDENYLFYIEDDGNDSLIFVKFVSRILTDASQKISGREYTTINGKIYETDLFGIKDKDIGIYHIVYDLNALIMIF